MSLNQVIPVILFLERMEMDSAKTGATRAANSAKMKALAADISKKGCPYKSTNVMKVDMRKGISNLNRMK